MVGPIKRKVRLGNSGLIITDLLKIVPVRFRQVVSLDTGLIYDIVMISKEHKSK